MSGTVITVVGSLVGSVDAVASVVAARNVLNANPNSAAARAA
jgi:hypothetical protein